MPINKKQKVKKRVSAKRRVSVKKYKRGGDGDSLDNFLAKLDKESSKYLSDMILKRKSEIESGKFRLDNSVFFGDQKELKNLSFLNRKLEYGKDTENLKKEIAQSEKKYTALLDFFKYLLQNDTYMENFIKFNKISNIVYWLLINTINHCSFRLNKFLVNCLKQKGVKLDGRILCILLLALQPFMARDIDEDSAKEWIKVVMDASEPLSLYQQYLVTRTLYDQNDKDYANMVASILSKNEDHKSLSELIKSKLKDGQFTDNEYENIYKNYIDTHKGKASPDAKIVKIMTFLDKNYMKITEMRNDYVYTGTPIKSDIQNLSKKKQMEIIKSC